VCEVNIVILSTPSVIDLPLRADENGVIRVSNTRVTLLSIVKRYRFGDSAEAIHEGFPTVPLADIHGVIAYYLSHQAEVDEYIAQMEAAAEQWRREYEANNPQVAASNAKLRALIAEKRKISQ
jgi:uncharacterized protein (DUF433 family)